MMTRRSSGDVRELLLEAVVLHSDGYCKHMDLYTAYPDDVEPLPYHEMAGYPPPEVSTRMRT